MFKILKSKRKREKEEFASFLKEFNSKYKNTNIWPTKKYDLNKIEIGEYSYGKLNLKSWDEKNVKLIIGKFCSIAEEVTFLLGGYHRYNTISTFPFDHFMIKQESLNDDLSKGSIVLKDDVWIGLGATIIAGVTIGQGAVVGAGAIVAKDIPPYAIVVGNPAKIIKYRFDKEIIDELLEFADYSKLTIEKVEKNMDFLLNQQLTKDNINEFRKIFEE
ncbi:MAG: CatB-related O-acetyltransferase [Candidatus Gastranaerophilaceae bacterium]|jgi:acetyltransferase-like isoleucine patch superfamily enzyme